MYYNSVMYDDPAPDKNLSGGIGVSSLTKKSADGGKSPEMRADDLPGLNLSSDDIDLLISDDGTQDILTSHDLTDNHDIILSVGESADSEPALQLNPTQIIPAASSKNRYSAQKSQTESAPEEKNTGKTPDTAATENTKDITLDWFDEQVETGNKSDEVVFSTLISEETARTPDTPEDLSDINKATQNSTDSIDLADLIRHDPSTKIFIPEEHDKLQKEDVVINQVPVSDMEQIDLQTVTGKIRDADKKNAPQDNAPDNATNDNSDHIFSPDELGAILSLTAKNNLTLHADTKDSGVQSAQTNNLDLADIISEGTPDSDRKYIPRDDFMPSADTSNQPLFKDDEFLLLLQNQEIPDFNENPGTIGDLITEYSPEANSEVILQKPAHNLDVPTVKSMKPETAERSSGGKINTAAPAEDDSFAVVEKTDAPDNTGNYESDAESNLNNSMLLLPEDALIIMDEISEDTSLTPNTGKPEKYHTPQTAGNAQAGEIFKVQSRKSDQPEEPTAPTTDDIDFMMSELDVFNGKQSDKNSAQSALDSFSLDFFDSETDSPPDTDAKDKPKNIEIPTDKVSEPNPADLSDLAFIEAFEHKDDVFNHTLKEQTDKRSQAVEEEGETKLLELYGSSNKMRSQPQQSLTGRKNIHLIIGDFDCPPDLRDKLLPGVTIPLINHKSKQVLVEFDGKIAGRGMIVKNRKGYFEVKITG